MITSFWGRLRAGSRAQASLVTLAGSLTGALAAFAAALVAAHSLGRGQFAAFGVGLAAGTLAVQMSDFGLATVTIAETAASWQAGQRQASYRALGNLAVYRLGSVTVLAGIAALVVLAIPGVGPYRSELLIGLGGSLFGSSALFLVAALQGARRFSGAGAVLVTLGLARLGLVSACALGGLHAVAMLTGYLVLAPLLAVGIGAIALGRMIAPNPEPAERAAGAPTPLAQEQGPDRRLRRAMWVAGVASAGIVNGDVLMLAVVSSQRQVAIYVSAWRVASGMLLLNASIGSALLPHVMLVRDVVRELRRSLRQALWLTAALLATVAPFTVVGLWLLGAAGGGAAAPLAILLSAFALGGFTAVVSQYYIRAGRSRFIAGVLVASLATMLLTIVLLRDSGASAPAIGHLVGAVLSIVCIGVPPMIALRGRLDWFGAPPAASGGHSGLGETLFEPRSPGADRSGS